MIEFLGVNVIAGIIAVILTMILGAIWFHPKVLGSIWAEVHGYDQSSLKPDSKTYVFAFLNTLVIVWVLGGFFNYFGISDLWGSLCFSFWAWLGFVATTHMSGVIWAKKPLKAYFIDAGFFLVALALIAIVLRFPS